MSKRKEIRFKNYQPTSEELKTNAKDSLTEIRQEIAQVEENTERLAQEAISNVPDLKDNMDLTHIAPQKPNWDLKRELETKMAPLERKTVKMLAEMTRIMINGSFLIGERLLKNGMGMNPEAEESFRKAIAMNDD